MYLGYFEKSEAPLTHVKDWYNTGDIGYINSEGFLYLEGRKNTFINIGGKKVNPFEIENVILRFPAINDVMVYGKETQEGDEVVQASIVVKTDLDSTFSLDKLYKYCREMLAFYKVPTEIYIVNKIPRTGLAKINRQKSY